MSAGGCAEEGTQTRRERIMRALAASSGPLSTPDLVRLADEGNHNYYWTLSWYGQLLRAFEQAGRVTRAGKTAGAWQRGPAFRWAITDEGRAWLAGIDAAIARAEAARDAVLLAAAAKRRRAEKLAEAAALYDRSTPRSIRVRVARELKDAGCTGPEIGAVFGVSREMIRLDLLGRAGGRSLTTPRSVS